MKYELKAWKEEYVKDIAIYANNENIAKYLRDAFPFPYKYEDAQWFVKKCIEAGDKKQLCRAIVVNGVAVGSIGIFLKDDIYFKTAEIGYWIGEPFWNQGIMSEAVKELCMEVFNSFDIVRIFAEPFANNTASRCVLQKAGFSLEGVLKDSVYKRGKILDSCIYSLLKSNC